MRISKKHAVPHHKKVEEEKIHIDRNVPLPSKTERWMKVFDKMQVGDSFLIKDCRRGMQNKIVAAPRYYGSNIVIISRRNGADVRFWRKK